MNPYIAKSNEIRNRLQQFCEEHEEQFTRDEIRMLQMLLAYGDVAEFFSDTFLAQLYEATGLVKKKCSTYYQMVQIMKQYFNLEKDVVEVGSGIFPIFGSYLRKEQLKLSSGTVTVYDPRLYIHYPTSAILKKEKFTLQTEIPKGGILVGLFPCEATEVMIEKALMENLEFCIALCGCNHSDDFWTSTREYHQQLIDKIAKSLPKNHFFKVSHFPRECFDYKSKGYPILIYTHQPKIKKFRFFSSY